MEVNKEQAEKCRDLGAAALRSGDFARAVKMFKKSLQLYPLPGVEALHVHAKQKLESSTSSSSNGNNASTAARAATNNTNNNNGSSNGAAAATGTDGRSYSAEQVRIVKNVLAAKEGGRGAHYRVLSIERTATESEIKKAYRKLSLKVHPDKNSAPHADEAFKAVGLAYATLSDSQKRTIYDRYGEEDPDNRGGSRAGGMHMRRPGGGQEMDPEEIFRAFFGGGMAGGPGVHFYSTGFGPGMQYRAGVPRRQRHAQQQQEAPRPGVGLLLQFLPLLLIMMVSFFSQSDDAYHRTMPGENQYFSLRNKAPFTNPQFTRFSEVKEIPYFVSQKFMRTYARDPYQRRKVEYMVERAYEQYLVTECNTQIDYKKKLWASAQRETAELARKEKLKFAKDFEMGRCDELYELFPKRKPTTSSTTTGR